MSGQRFVPGLELCRAFFQQAVQPLLADRFPDLAYAAGRLGSGSDVWGFDTPESMDHDWGPQLALFVDEANYPQRQAIDRVLGRELPLAVKGFSTHFGPSLLVPCERHLRTAEQRPIEHGVKIWTVADFFASYLGFDPRQPIAVADWLSLPPQRLREVTGGEIFHDGLGQWTELRQRLAWYPEPIWRYLLASQWRHLGREQAYMVRCGDSGDELGSRLVAGRQVDEIMRLCFLLERQYAPYYKWFGTAFARLECAGVLGPILAAVLAATDWRQREALLAKAYGAVADLQNDLALIEPIELHFEPLRQRPCQVANYGDFVAALRASIDDPQVRALPVNLGGIGQFVDSTEVYERLELSRSLARVYEESPE